MSKSSLFDRVCIFIVVVRKKKMKNFKKATQNCPKKISLKKKLLNPLKV